MIKALTQRLQAIPSIQSQQYGDMGFVASREEYALTGKKPLNDYPDPGRHRTLGVNAAQQRDSDIQYNFMANVYNSQENVRQAINNALTVAVPEMYRRAQGNLGPAIYAPTEDPRAILLSLSRRYGKRTPAEKGEAAKNGQNRGTQLSPSRTCSFNWRNYIYKPSSQRCRTCWCNYSIKR